MHRVHAKWKCTVCKYFYLPECKHRFECPLCSPSVVAGLSLLQFPCRDPHIRSPLKIHRFFLLRFNTFSQRLRIRKNNNNNNMEKSTNLISDTFDPTNIDIERYSSDFFHSSIFSSLDINNSNRIENFETITLTNWRNPLPRFEKQTITRSFKNDSIDMCLTILFKLHENSLPSSSFIVFDSFEEEEFRLLPNGHASRIRKIFGVYWHDWGGGGRGGGERGRRRAHVNYERENGGQTRCLRSCGEQLRFNGRREAFAFASRDLA